MSAKARLSSKAQVVVPKQVREALGLKPGDVVLFRESPSGMVIERAEAEEDPFVTFSEWASAADDEAYADL